MRWLYESLLIVVIVFLLYGTALCEEVVFSKTKTLSVDYLEYRPVSFEKKKVKEVIDERPNKGGLVLVYLRNAGDEPLGIKQWYLERKSGSRWRLSGDIAWDRLYEEYLKPGEMTVLEICGLSSDFARGKRFEFGVREWGGEIIGGKRGAFEGNELKIPYMRFLPGRSGVEVHLRNESKRNYQLVSAQVPGREVVNVEWTSEKLARKGAAICRIELNEAVAINDLVVVKIELRDSKGKEKIVCTHRRAFDDYFPIGTWGAEPDNYARTKRAHIDTVIKGDNPQDEFYTKHWKQYDLKAMMHTGVIPRAQQMQRLAHHPAIVCWMPHDEPEWSYTSQMMFTSNEATKQINSKKPTFMTFCRNVKFFEYAYIPDIAGQDHYSVTAPSTSKWPTRYGTRLEETAYYTRDLKVATAPKPCWVWTQGIFDWDQRPKRPVPTVEELQSQLLLNLSRGPKGLLWFCFNTNVTDKYPELVDAITKWGRVLEMIREDMLGSEPLEGLGKAKNLDVQCLVGWDRMLVFVNNLNYKIDDEAYQWKDLKNVVVTVQKLDWTNVQEAAILDPEGVKDIPMKIGDGDIQIQLDKVHVGEVLVLGAEGITAEYQQRFEKTLEEEVKY